jgi:hypothetical protein
MLAEYAVLSEEAIVPVPSHLSFEEAATLPCAAVTAWVALTRDRRATAGDTVLTQGSGAFRPLLYSLPGLGRPSDRDNLNRGKSREAQGAGGLRGDQLS